MRREGWDIGRDQCARLMRQAGMRGVIRGRRPRTTRPSSAPDHRPDLVERNFHAAGLNRLWVADITCDASIATRPVLYLTSLFHPLYRARRTLLTDKQQARLDALFADGRHVEVEATWGVSERGMFPIPHVCVRDIALCYAA